jgi:glycosyltransferase involved in cell wall biosynthesis
MLPMYLPVRTDEDEDAVRAPIFFGGINVYLQQKSGLFRKTPRWIDRWLDSPALLRWAARRSGMTSASDLGRMTVSMLRGVEGRQAKELNRLVDWLDTRDNKPDVVFLSNAMLLGLAGRIKTRVGVPVLCLLQDEDGFLDALSEPYSGQAWEMLRQQAGGIDAFIAVSKYYAEVMCERLQPAAERVHVVYPGIALDGFVQVQGGPEVPTIGFLSRTCFNKGLDTLVEAFIGLKKNEKLKNSRLQIAGGSTPADKDFINQIRQKVNGCGFGEDVRFLPDFDRDTRLSFFQTLSVLSVPERQPVAYGLYVLEALAAGVAVVEPARGALPELLEMTGGGILYEPDDAAALSTALQKLLLDPDYARRLGQQGRKAVFADFNVDQTAGKMVRICEEVVRQFRRG